MKQFTTLILTIFLATTLAACASVKKSSTHVKCPACGYEFDVPQQ